jgi:hypothetical protein
MGLITMGIYHAFIGIIEGGATACALSLILRARPDIIGEATAGTAGKARDVIIFAGIALALCLAIIAPFYASTYPDGLDSTFLTLSGAKSPETVHINEEKAQAAHEALVEKTGNTVSWQAPFTDYAIPGMEKPGEVLAIAFGVIVLFILGFGLSRFFAGKS